MANDIKLSKAQKGIVKDMQVGAVLRKDKQSDYFLLIRGNGMTSRITAVIAENLIKKEAVEQYNALMKSEYYRLTDKGKTIKL